ncbi:MAG: 5'-3' exonuclease H3TH domain-containing protein, partial [Granulosicoccaceae bacterium]
MSTDAPLVLVDGSSYLFRAFHALPPLTNSNGEPTGAIHGVVNMLKRLLASYPTQNFVVVFDAPGKTFRHEMYPEYKANRPPMPDDLRSQIEPLHAIVRAMGMPLLAVPEVEADDVIGTLAKQASDEGRAVVISTGDKDMAQLVNEHVTLVNTMSDTTMDDAGVVEKFGVPANRIIDYLALVGDKVDNIPGVPSCGPKTAVKWLGLYDSMEGVMAHADEVKGKIGEKLRAALPDLPMSYQLATINCEVALDLDDDSLVLSAPDNDALRDLFTHLEMRSALRDLGEAPADAGEQAALSAAQPTAPAGKAVAVKNHEVVTDAERFGEWLARLAAASEFAFDTETTSLEYMKAKVVGVSFAIEAGEAAYVPCGHDYEDAPEQLSLDDVLGGLAPLLADSSKTIIGQNLKYDLHVLANHGVEVRAQLHDTMLQSYMLDAAGSRHDMDTLANKHLGVKTIKYEEVAGKGKA